MLTMTLLGITAVIAASSLSSVAALLALIFSVLFIACSLIFTAWRYREIAKLSAYVRQINGGDYTLDLRDNKEGELSVLKNDIYKVTLKLSEQSSLLKQDKAHLSDAIADISHQLKTPLTSMMVMTDLLSNDKLSEKKRAEFTNNISIQLERIEWLVSSLLKLSKIDAGTVSFNKDEIKVSDIIKKALEPLLIPMDIKELYLSLQGEDTVRLRGDLNWTAEALTNIIKNCVEHTPRGGKISIVFGVNPLYTEIIISDNGSGIARQDIPYIFRRFYKGKNSGRDSAGIGLNLAHSIITAQNGDIEVWSEEGAGSRFTVKFYTNVI